MKEIIIEKTDIIHLDNDTFSLSEDFYLFVLEGEFSSEEGPLENGRVQRVASREIKGQGRAVVILAV